MAFEITTEQFQGPFDLLLDLIEKRKFFINEISLAKVTDDFISYIQTQENFPMGESASFILVAATLLLIKSKSLLPHLELTTEEQGDMKSLETRLAIYQRIREAGKVIEEKFGKTILFAPAERKFSETVFSPGSITSQHIFESVKKIIAQIPKVEQLPKVVVQKVISLEEMIERLTIRVEKSLKMSFRDFAGHDKSEKIHVIVGFLAMLELVKRGIIQAEQKGSFDEIEIESPEIGVPRYT